MARVDPLRALERSPYFKGIPTAVLHGVSMFTEERVFRAGEVLLRQGSPADAAFLVAAGEIGAEGPGGDVFGVGSLVGHLDLLNGGAASATWVARAPGAALTFTGDLFQKLLAERGPSGSAFRRALIISLSEQLRAANLAVGAYVAANPQAARPSRGFLDELSGVLSGTRSSATRKK